MTMNPDHSLAVLVAAADKINSFARPFTLAGNRRGEDTLVLASVWALVMDDNGGPLEATDTPSGDTRLTVDIEFFRENARTLTAKGRAEIWAAEKAEADVITFCKDLGFDVRHETHTGSGAYGPCNTLVLTPGRSW